MQKPLNMFQYFRQKPNVFVDEVAAGGEGVANVGDEDSTNDGLYTVCNSTRDDLFQFAFQLQNTNTWHAFRG